MSVTEAAEVILENVEDVVSVPVEVKVNDLSVGSDAVNEVEDIERTIECVEDIERTIVCDLLDKSGEEDAESKLLLSTVIPLDIDEIETHADYEHTILVPVQEVASMSVDGVYDQFVADLSSTTPSQELQSPEQQHRAARLAAVTTLPAGSSDPDEFVPPSTENSGHVETERPLKKKQPTSTERRALRDAKLAQVAQTSEVANTQLEMSVATSAVDNNADNSFEKPKSKKLSSKQRKAQAKKLAASNGELSTSAEIAEAPEPTILEIVVVDKSVSATSASEEVSGVLSTKAKNPGSKQRKAMKRAAEAAAAADTLTALGVATVSTSELPAVATSSLIAPAASSEPAKKLSSKQRKAAKLAREEAAPAVAVVAEVVTSAPKLVQPKSVAKIASDNKTINVTPTVLPITPNASIALHAAVAVVRQSLLSRDSAVYTHNGAMKMLVLTELCKLGYECVEGGVNNFQQISWSAPDQCLVHTSAILNAPHQYPASLRPKGDLKLAAPALSMRLKCYPAFGVDSPVLVGAKSFRTGFIRSVQEVAVGETDSFVFVLPLHLYTEFALDAMGSLPAVHDIKRHFTERSVAYGLRVVCCTVQTAHEEFVIGSLLVV